jgi:uncharacterized phage protein (TIGR01671 family)
MSREIKFRAWDKEKKIMRPVTLMDFRAWWVSCSIIPHATENPLEFGERNSFTNAETDRHILMQYTGLHDKNGKEIFEGDILLNQFCIDKWTVQFINGCWMACLIPNSGFIKHDPNMPPLNELLYEVCELWEVIGNIWDNPMEVQP